MGFDTWAIPSTNHRRGPCSFSTAHFGVLKGNISHQPSITHLWDGVFVFCAVFYLPMHSITVQTAEKGYGSLPSLCHWPFRRKTSKLCGQLRLMRSEANGCRFSFLRPFSKGTYHSTHISSKNCVLWKSDELDTVKLMLSPLKMNF